MSLPIRTLPGAPPPTVHEAGAYEDLLQRCARCGEVLVDNRNVMYVTTDGPPRGYEPGPITVWSGNPRMSMTGRAPDAVECTRAERVAAHAQRGVHVEDGEDCWCVPEIRRCGEASIVVHRGAQ